MEWLKSRSVFGVLCNHIIPMKLKGAFYKTAIDQQCVDDQNVGQLLRTIFKNECSRNKNVQMDRG